VKELHTTRKGREEQLQAAGWACSFLVLTVDWLGGDRWKLALTRLALVAFFAR